MTEWSAPHMRWWTHLQSYLSATSSLPGLVAKAAATRKGSKYAAIMLTHIFVPIAVEILGSVNAKDLRFPDQIVDRLSAVTGDPRELSFLHQRLPVSVLVQRFNMIAFHYSFISETDTKA